MRGRVAAIPALSTALLAIGLSVGVAAAQEPPPSAPKEAAGAHEAAAAEGAAEGEETEHANEVAVFLGGTTENDETNFTIGAEYERRLSARFGLGLVVEHVSGTDAWVFLAPFSFRPVRGLGLKLYAGPGFESKVPESEETAEGAHSGLEEHGRESIFVARTGVGWGLELGRVSLTPQVEVDFAREAGRWETALVFGIAVGLGF